MNTLIIVSKPLDVLHSDDLVYGLLEKSMRHYLVVGTGPKQEQLIKLLQDRGSSFSRVGSFDLYYDSIKRLRSFRGLKYVLAGINYFYWHKALFYKFPGKWDNVVLDFWRNKACLLSRLDYESLYIIDGGFSTVTWGLANNWIDFGPIQALKRYIRSQKVDKPRTATEKYPLHNIFGRITGTTPFLVRRFIFKSLDEQKTIELYSAYCESNISLRVGKNEFVNGPGKIPLEIDRESALIIGYPNGELFNRQIQRIARIEESTGNAFSKVYYRWHPSTTLDDIEREEFINVFDRSILEHNTVISLEFDLLNMAQIPKSIFGYNSSSTVWLQSLNMDLNIYIIE